LQFQLVADKTIFTLRLGPETSTHSRSVTITKDDRFEWTYVQPSWRSLAWGSGEGSTYLWSARAIIVLPITEMADPGIIDVDEDLLYVFKVKGGWLLVCETSVRYLSKMPRRPELN
jgi:hypothetical protein